MRVSERHRCHWERRPGRLRLGSVVRHEGGARPHGGRALYHLLISPSEAFFAYIYRYHTSIIYANDSASIPQRPHKHVPNKDIVRKTKQASMKHCGTIYNTVNLSGATLGVDLTRVLSIIFLPRRLRNHKTRWIDVSLLRVLPGLPLKRCFTTTGGSAETCRLRTIDVAQRSRLSPLNPERTTANDSFALTRLRRSLGTGTAAEVDECASRAVDTDDALDLTESGEEGTDVVFCEIVFHPRHPLSAQFNA